MPVGEGAEVVEGVESIFRFSVTNLTKQGRFHMTNSYLS